MNLSAVAAVLALSTVSHAALAADPAAGLKICAAIADKADRLTCFDALAAGLQVSVPAQATVSAAPAIVAPAPVPSAPPRVQTRPEEFGSEAIVPPAVTQTGSSAVHVEPEALKSITDKVAEVAFNAAGRFTVTLSNGQVWQQASSDDERARFTRRGDLTVTISRGLLGSYNLSASGSNVVYKVRRVK